MLTRFKVHATNGKEVWAKYLEIDGRLIRDAAGNPYTVPADFDWNAYMGKFERFGEPIPTMDGSLPGKPLVTRNSVEVYRYLYDQFHADWPASPSDVQRTYNGYTGKKLGDFVPAFTPAASFLFGAACAAAGLGERGALAGGGAQNALSSFDSLKRLFSLLKNPRKSFGSYLNAPDNVPNIENGWNAYTNGISASDGALDKARTPKDSAGNRAKGLSRPYRAMTSERMQSPTGPVPSTDVRPAPDTIKATPGVKRTPAGVVPNGPHSFYDFPGGQNRLTLTGIPDVVRPATTRNWLSPGLPQGDFPPLGGPITPYSGTGVLAGTGAAAGTAISNPVTIPGYGHTLSAFASPVRNYLAPTMADSVERPDAARHTGYEGDPFYVRRTTTGRRNWLLPQESLENRLLPW